MSTPDHNDPIRFNDFKQHYAAVRDRVDPAVQRVLSSGWYILGEELRRFEQRLAEYLGVAHCVGVASGTDAIALALAALDVGPGDEVVTTNMTAYPTITGIKLSGATPVVVDIDRRTGLLDPERLENAFTSRTRAIVPVHLYGQSCDLDPILALAQQHGLVVVEDCAQAIGATYRGRSVGACGDAGCFSFYPTKNLGAFGDAGGVAANKQEHCEKLQRLRNYGQVDRYHHDLPGRNSRLDELQAAILTEKIELLDGWTERRRKIAHCYQEQLTTVAPIARESYGEDVYHLFPVEVDDRERFMAYMDSHGIQTLVHYPVPVNRQRDFAGQKDEAFPAAEALAARIVSLPLHPELTDSQVERVVRTVNAFA